jgi:hypothetical protein
MPAAREAVSRRPECPGRSSSGSTISGPQAGRPGSASSHPEEARHSEARTILTPGSARNLLQSPEGGRNRYFKIDFPFFGDGYPRRGEHVAEMPLQALRSPVWRFAFLVMFFARPPALVVLCGGDASARPQSVPLARRLASLIAVRSARSARRRTRSGRPHGGHGGRVPRDRRVRRAAPP